MAVYKPVILLSGVFKEHPTTTDTLQVGAGSFRIAGSFAGTFTFTAGTSVTFPTSGTLATLSGTETLTNKRLDLTTIEYASGLTFKDAAFAGAQKFTITYPSNDFNTAFFKTLTIVNNSFTQWETDTGTGTLYFPGEGRLVTEDGSVALTNKELVSALVTTSTIVGGTADELTSLSFRSTGSAFDVKLASSEVMSADRTISWNLSNANRAITLAGNLSIGGNFTISGGFTCTITIGANTALTFPASGTLAILGANTYTGTQDLGTNILKGVKNAVHSTPTATSGTTGAVTVDFSATSVAAQAELTGAITYTATAPADANQWVTIIGASDGTSAAFGITWPASFIWFGTAFTTTVANKKWMVRAWWDGTNYWASGVSQV